MRQSFNAKLESCRRDSCFQVPTRDSLLSQLKDISNEESWREFYGMYSGMILASALKHGLTQDEAAEVVQETMVAVVKEIPGFKYDRNKGSFRGWLMTITYWRILKQIRKRTPSVDPADADRLEAPQDFQDAWEEDWQNSLLSEALSRTRARYKPENYQIFYFAVILGKGSKEAAKIFGRSLPAVYLHVCRVKRAIQKEVRKLQRENF